MRYFKLVTPFGDIMTRNFEIGADLVNPLASEPVLEGEWLQLDTSYHATRFINDANHVDAGADNAGEVISFPLFAESGRYDVQALKKVPLLFLHGFEADSHLVDLTNLYIGAPLEVADIEFPAGSGVDRRALRLATGTHFVVGYVTRLFTDKVRFIRTAS